MKTCTLCGQELDPTRPHYVQVQGWAKIRSEGGVNQLKRKDYTGNLAHVTCVEHGFAPSFTSAPMGPPIHVSEAVGKVMIEAGAKVKEEGQPQEESRSTLFPVHSES